jgi:DNA-binding response OmpR family regulator
VANHHQEISILIVEGDRVARERLAVGLSKDRYRVIASVDAEDGLYQLALERPALVVLHLARAPGDDGQVTRRFREASTAPLIVLADDKDLRVQTENLRQGADYVLPASVSIRELRARVRALAWRSQTPHLPGSAASPVPQGWPISLQQTHDQEDSD